MKKIILCAFLAVILNGCGVPQNKYDTLEQKYHALETELLKYKEKYGEFPIINESNNEFGIWETKFYVDDFGEFTKNGYVTNSNIIIGKFSNSATQDSELAVRFLITNKDDIDIMLYEYGRNNPVKNSGLNIVLVQDNDGNRYRLSAYNRSDRLSLSRFSYYDETGNKVLEKSHARMLYNILMKGGNIKFNISESNHSTSVYNFSILNADNLGQAIESIGIDTSN